MVAPLPIQPSAAPESACASSTADSGSCPAAAEAEDVPPASQQRSPPSPSFAGTIIEGELHVSAKVNRFIESFHHFPTAEEAELPEEDWEELEADGEDAASEEAMSGR